MSIAGMDTPKYSETLVTQPGTSRRTKPYLGRNQLQCNSEALLLGQQSERFSLQDIKSLIGQDTFSKQEWHHQ